jgi:uncharacterized flavoprotein (TIGR03862 family)
MSFPTEIASTTTTDAARPDDPVRLCPAVAVVGGGPAGLMAAEALLAGGARVDLYDAMPSVGRKFLLAGKGGLNLTHSEPMQAFVSRFGGRAEAVSPWLGALSPQALREWVHGLGIETFVGTSGRVFPRDMKAAPLLRAWLHRLRQQGLQLHMRHRWLGWGPGDGRQDADAEAGLLPDRVAEAHRPDGIGTAADPLILRFETPAGLRVRRADALVLALGGASWPQLGSDGAWVTTFGQQGVPVAPLQPANCGFDVGWSPYFAQRFAGSPMKSVRLKFDDGRTPPFDRAGEFVITAGGIEGSLVYAASAALRDEIARAGSATVTIDLVPGRDEERLAEGLRHGRGTRSLPNHLREHAGLDGVKAALLRERYDAAALTRLVADAPRQLARELKAWPLVLKAPRPVAEAISTAGGVLLEALDDRLMVRALPGVFCAGEMLDWEAPTGGYLLSASLASGRVAGRGVLQWWRPAVMSPA